LRGELSLIAELQKNHETLPCIIDDAVQSAPTGSPAPSDLAPYS
jgi:hypothetical protein